MRRIWLALALTAGFCAPASAIRIEKLDLRAYPALRGAAAAAGGTLEVVAEQVLVRFSTAADDAARRSALRAKGAELIAELPFGWTQVALPAGFSVAPGLDLLRSAAGVLDVSPNRVYRPNKVPNGPQFSSQWNLAQINAPAAWEYEVGASCRTTVVVIDTGIDGTQPDLSGKIVGGLYCSPGNSKNDVNPPGDNGPCVAYDPKAPDSWACNHATRVAGIAAATANNSVAIAGVSWDAQLLSIKVFRDADCADDCSGAGCGTDDAAVITAISFSTGLQNTAQYGRLAINISLGGTGDCSEPVANALAAAVSKDIPVAIAAGNDGGEVNSPAICAASVAVVNAGGGVMPVGAVDSANNIASFSSRGAALAGYGVAAPGVGVLTTDVNNGLASPMGTSFAAPHVAGLAALILAAKPDFSAADVQNAIRGGADSIGVAGLEIAGRPLGELSGAGRINAFRSMRLAVRGTLADFDGDKEPIAFPNPFRTSRTGSVSFSIPTSLQGRDAKIKVYTTSGELVRELTGLTWDGKNKGGHPVATGSYLFVVSTDKGSARGRLAVIR
ncbi:MAG: S8 family serine peptidase [Elusimicrobia bacterium]|nr:S8 family serine peptidase [Elusimicrobiota bacterium]